MAVFDVPKWEGMKIIIDLATTHKTIEGLERIQRS